MPSFLSKVFGRKKHDEQDAVPRASDASLLEGNFVAVSPPTSPSATQFAESTGREKEKDRDGFFGIVRSRSRPSLNTLSVAQKPVDDRPHLTLNLPGSANVADARALGVVFEADLDSQVMLADSDLGQRRLNPDETLKLVKACSQVITARGLETLGIMHPHWYATSPDVQRKLISLFVQSLDTDKAITRSPTAPSDLTPFESELKFTRSPHDVAAILRWGLRHLKLDGTSFGKDSAEWSWYTKFSKAERQSSYLSKAYSEILPPQVVPAHFSLLSATLETLSSLAAHAEANSISGSKLSKFLGFWLLCAQRSDKKDDWSTFYARWERAGRILEHLFLARIRDEALSMRMPTRLLELVQHYPYSKTPPTDEFLARPKFSTRQYDALFVRVETEVSGPNAVRTKLHPVRLIVEALKAQSTGSGRDEATWEKIKTAAIAEAEEEPIPLDGRPAPSCVFADETVRFLTLLPAETPPKEATAPKFTLLPALSSPPQHVDRSVNGNALSSTVTSTDGHSQATVTAATSAQPKVDVVVTDWTQFATAGFHDSPPIPQILAGTFLDKDVVPRKKRKAVSPARSRRSLDGDKTTIAESAPAPAAPEETKPVSRSTLVTTVQLDEAFVDFWNDALLDPISSAWPSFVICRLKQPVGGGDAESARKPIEWLVIEHVYKTVATAAGEPAQNASSSQQQQQQTSKKARPSSPKPSFRSDQSISRMGSTLAATKKRFSFLTTTVRTSISNDGGQKSSARGRHKVGKAPRVGEMGEILSEEEEKPLGATPAITVEHVEPEAAKRAEPEREILEAVNAAVVAAGGATLEPVAPPTPPKDVAQEVPNGTTAIVQPTVTSEAPIQPESEDKGEVEVEPSSLPSKSEPDEPVADSVVPPIAPPAEPPVVQVTLTDEIPDSVVDSTPATKIVPDSAAIVPQIDESAASQIVESEPVPVTQEPDVPDQSAVDVAISLDNAAAAAAAAAPSPPVADAHEETTKATQPATEAEVVQEPTMTDSSAAEQKDATPEPVVAKDVPAAPEPSSPPVVEEPTLVSANGAPTDVDTAVLDPSKLEEPEAKHEEAPPAVVEVVVEAKTEPLPETKVDVAVTQETDGDPPSAPADGNDTSVGEKGPAAVTVTPIVGDEVPTGAEEEPKKETL